MEIYHYVLDVIQHNNNNNKKWLIERVASILGIQSAFSLFMNAIVVCRHAGTDVNLQSPYRITTQLTNVSLF